MEEIYRGTLANTLEYIAINVDQFCTNGDLINARRLDEIKYEILSSSINYDTEIVLYKNDIVGYHYEVVEEEKSIYDIVKDTQKEFETMLSFGAMYGSDTQEPRFLTEVEREILNKYVSVFTSRLIVNLRKFNDKGDIGNNEVL